MTLFGLITSDLRAKAVWVYGGVSTGSLWKTWCTDGTAAMVVYRLMQWCQRRHLVPLAMFFNKWNAVWGQCLIGRNAQFGPGFVLIHSQGVVVNSAVRGGANVRLEHQVTIGAEKGVAPILGDDVFAGAGARILGAVRVGSRTRIGANAVVLSDIPDGATAVGVPARVVKDERTAESRSDGPC